jgi:hypothetical protein
MKFDGVDERYMVIAKDVFDGGYTPPGSDATLKRRGNTFAWYAKETDVVLGRYSQIKLFKIHNIEKPAVYNALRKLTL